jgi:hypothetical protein
MATRTVTTQIVKEPSAENVTLDGSRRWTISPELNHWKIYHRYLPKKLVMKGGLLYAVITRQTDIKNSHPAMPIKTEIKMHLF